MRCPFCDNSGSRVTDSRTSLSGVRRRRECGRCSLRFTTYEKVHVVAPMVVKVDGRREPYDHTKLTRSITLACTKREVATEKIGELVADIELRLFRMGQAEIESRFIGEEVISKLRGLDHVAYIRYASVYNNFEHLSSFAEAVEEVEKIGGHTVPKDQLVLFGDTKAGVVQSVKTVNLPRRTSRRQR